MCFFQKNYPSNLTLNLLNLQNPSSNFLNWSPYISLKNIIWEDLFQGSNYFPLGYHFIILRDPGTDSGGERKSKHAEKYGTNEK